MLGRRSQVVRRRSAKPLFSGSNPLVASTPLSFGDLVEVYGALLTERQREVLELHHVGGKSLAEIGRRTGVSRQAVHDAATSGETLLLEFEEKLGLAARLKGKSPTETPKPPPRARTAATHSPAVAERLERLCVRLNQQRILYSTDWLVTELRQVLQELRGETGK